MKIIRIVLVCFFLFLLLLKFYFRITDNNLSQPFFLGTVLLTSLILILLFPSKVTWCLGMVVFAFGIYYEWHVEFLLPEPGFMQFTYPLQRLIYGGRTGSGFRHFLSLFPLLFYTCALIAFFDETCTKTLLYYLSVKRADYLMPLTPCSENSGLMALVQLLIFNQLRDRDKAVVAKTIAASETPVPLCVI